MSDASFVKNLIEKSKEISESTGKLLPENYKLALHDDVVRMMLENNWIEQTPEEDFVGRIKEQFQNDLAVSLLDGDLDDLSDVSLELFEAIPAIPPVGTKVYRKSTL